MLCSKCSKREATVHISGQVNDQKYEMDMCEDCAASSGFSVSFGAGGSLMPFPSMLSPMAELLNFLPKWTAPAIAAPARSSCPTCHWTLKEFQSIGKMGCPDCYAHFRKDLYQLLDQIQGSHIHKGKKQTKEASMKEKKDAAPDSIHDLKHRLEKAIKDEEYEQAAVLRDKIRDLENANRPA